MNGDPFDRLSFFLGGATFTSVGDDLRPRFVGVSGALITTTGSLLGEDFLAGEVVVLAGDTFLTGDETTFLSEAVVLAGEDAGFFGATFDGEPFLETGTRSTTHMF